MSNIIITGCSSGIGFATAVLLAENKHTVFATMRNPSHDFELHRLAEKKELPIIILPLDVSKDSSVDKAFTQILDNAGRIDVLINNAGIGTIGAIEELPITQFMQEMDTNYLGTVRCTKAVLPHMRERNSGCIINISSVAGKLYDSFSAPYAASKAAVEAFSESLAKEVLPFGIRVAVVEPGVIDTPMHRKSGPLYRQDHYPNLERAVAFFKASADQHISPLVVADVINKIVKGSYKKFRNTAGPDSKRAIDMRADISDEDWIASAQMDKDSWIKMMDSLQLDVGKYLSKK